MGAEEGQDTAVVTYNGSTMMITLEVCAAEPTDPGTLSYDWRDSEGNSLGNIDSWIDLHSFADGARYSCTVTDSYGQSATLWFELRWERGEDDPTEAEMENASPISVGDTVDVEVTDSFGRICPLADMRMRLLRPGSDLCLPRAGLMSCFPPLNPETKWILLRVFITPVE